MFLGGFVINHLPHPQRALAEAVRVLVSGGQVAFSVWDRPERMRVIGVVKEAIETAGVDRDAPPSSRWASASATVSSARRIVMSVTAAA